MSTEVSAVGYDKVQYDYDCINHLFYFGLERSKRYQNHYYRVDNHYDSHQPRKLKIRDNKKYLDECKSLEGPINISKMSLFITVVILEAIINHYFADVK